MTPQQQWALSAAQGDSAALARVLEHFQDRVFRVALRMVSHADDAAEVAQESLLNVVRNIGGFRGDSEIGTWIIRITMNQSLTHLRRRKLRRAASLDALGDDDGAASAGAKLVDDREPDPGWRVEQDEMLDRLKLALGQVEEPFRSILVLRDLEQMDYPQIGKVLDLPAGTVKSRLFRARLALRQVMLAMENQPAPTPAGTGVTPAAPTPPVIGS